MQQQVKEQPHPQKVEAICPVCHSHNAHQFLTSLKIPVLSNVLWSDRADALNAPCGDIRLVFCSACGHVFNQAYDPANLSYDTQYENSLHFSARFQSYASWLAGHLIQRYDLRGKSIVEIGSGKGDFLRILCEMGGNSGTGFDPSYEPLAEDHHPSISFIRDFYSEKYAGYQADFILFRHVLEHIYHPDQFINSLRRTIGERLNTVVFCEVPNLAYMLRETAIWDILYEHYSYFSPLSLSALFERAGFSVLNLEEVFEGQFLIIELVPRGKPGTALDTSRKTQIDNLAGQVADFARLSQAKVKRWREQVHQIHARGRRAVVWGAGSKGISFLNMLNIQHEIDYIVDINPRKKGKYVTGTGQQIVSPEFLQEYRPDTIIVMNPIYRQEIQQQLDGIGISAEMVLAS